MLYALVVLGIPVEGPFDYLVPPDLEKTIKPGQRVWVSFGARRMLGFVVGLSRQTQIKDPKKILEILDEGYALDKKMLSLTRELSRYYCCSWGEAIETALPPGLRKGRKMSIAPIRPERPLLRQELMVLHDLDEAAKWDVYLSKIKDTLGAKRSVLVLFPDHSAVLKARQKFHEALGIMPILLYRKQAAETSEWLKIREGRSQVVLALRSGIFAPLPDLGLVIIDAEHDQAYKQDQVPHYHARDVALMRVNREKASLILASASPTLESIYLTRKGKMKYVFIPRKAPFPEIKILDLKRLSYKERKKNLFLSRYLEDAINATLSEKGKVLLFLNRKGFATFAYCHTCGFIQRCPRCDVHLVYYFNEKLLRCHRCSFKTLPPEICPHCLAGYIKYSGTGTQKVESELARTFPHAHIQRIEDFDNLDLKEVDMAISTSAIIKHPGCHFDLVAVLGIDNSLNRMDWRASEKTFGLLIGLLGLTDKKMIIQTSSPDHICFQALFKKDISLFYEEELRQRKQLNFPPHKHMIFVKFRGKIEEKVKEVSHAFFKRINEANGQRDIRVVSVNRAQPSQLRGNYYWQVLLIAKYPKKASLFLKINLKDFSHSGIIVTVDVDPV
ncbi:MAG: primosomal protein N' [Candidatus Omnitrophota bacterium]